MEIAAEHIMIVAELVRRGRSLSGLAAKLGLSHDQRAALFDGVMEYADREERIQSCATHLNDLRAHHSGGICNAAEV